MPVSPFTNHGAAANSMNARFSKAGLVRAPRKKKSAAPARNADPHNPSPNVRFERNTPDELTAPPPIPLRAANGVEWLPIPGWDLPWLWAGFSTRKGGLSHAYCTQSFSNVEDAAGLAADLGLPGELKLGFTAADDRETVQRNRRLLAEAITSNPATFALIGLTAIESFQRCLYPPSQITARLPIP